MRPEHDVTVTLTPDTVELALNALEGAAADPREPERYQEWYREARAELLTAVTAAAVAK